MGKTSLKVDCWLWFLARSTRTQQLGKKKANSFRHRISNIINYEWHWRRIDANSECSTTKCSFEGKAAVLSWKITSIRRHQLFWFQAHKWAAMQSGCFKCSVTCMYIILRNVRYEAFHVCREYTHLNSQSLCCNKQAWLCKVTSIAEALGAIEWFKCQYELSQLHHKTLQ